MFKFILTILAMMIFNLSFSQIGISYSIGVFGENLNVSNNSNPVSVSGINCVKVASDLSKFMPSSFGTFFNECMVNLDYVKLNITLLPNPVVDYLTVKFKNKISTFNRFKIGVFNNVGAVSNFFEVNQDQLLYGYRIDMSNYPTGVYFVKIVSNNIQETYKIFKED
jgi:hypothetical protein